MYKIKYGKMCNKSINLLKASSYYEKYIGNEENKITNI